MLESGNKTAQNKLKLLFILNFIDIPLTNTEITNFILDNGYMDYFTLQDILSELCSAKFVELNSKNGNEYYSISNAGIATLDMFNEKLPVYFIDEISSKFTNFKKELKKHRELLGHYYKKSENAYIVSLQVMENESVIFNLSIDVPTEELAKTVCKRWNANPDGIFQSIIKTITSD